MSRAGRRAMLRGALPSILAIIVLPIAPHVVPGFVFFALIPAALSVLDMALGDGASRLWRGVALAASGTVLTGVAIFQAIYAAGVVSTGTLHGGLAALAETCQHLIESSEHGAYPWSAALFVVACAGLGHASAILAASLPRPKVFFADDDVNLTLLGAPPVALAIAVINEPSIAAIGITLVLIPLATALTLAMRSVFAILTFTCDGIEQSLWRPAATDEPRESGAPAELS